MNRERRTIIFLRTNCAARRLRRRSACGVIRVIEAVVIVVERAGQEFAGVRLIVAGYLLGRARGDHAASCIAAFGA